MGLELIRRHLEEPLAFDTRWTTGLLPNDPAGFNPAWGYGGWDTDTGWPGYLKGKPPVAYNDNYLDGFNTNKTFISANIVKDGSPHYYGGETAVEGSFVVSIYSPYSEGTGLALRLCGRLDVIYKFRSLKLVKTYDPIPTYEERKQPDPPLPAFPTEDDKEVFTYYGLSEQTADNLYRLVTVTVPDPDPEKPGEVVVKTDKAAPNGEHTDQWGTMLNAKIEAIRNKVTQTYASGVVHVGQSVDNQNYYRLNWHVDFKHWA